MIDEVLKRITPTKKEQAAIKKVCKTLIGLIYEQLTGSDLEFEVRVLGSVSRGTWLAHKKDIDIFVSFPTACSKKELEDTVTVVGRKILRRMEKRFAEHPYVRGEFEGYSIEIVPCYNVKNVSGRISAVDRSPFHDRYIKRNLAGREGEVRLLKQFLMGIGCYGAEAKVEGFSGYLCELLIICYGSFEGTLSAAASKWKPGEMIDIKGEGDSSTFKPTPPLIFIDPTDNKRNVASALSQQNFSLFLFAAKEFLKKPKISFFFPRKRHASRKEVLEKLNLRGTDLLTVTFQNPGVIDDILYPQLEKAKRLFVNRLIDSDFSVLNAGFFVGESITFAFELKSLTIPKAKLHFGPPVNSKNEGDFRKKHIGSPDVLTSPYICEDHWAVIVKREHRHAEEYLTSFLSQKNLKEKGIPSNIAKSIQKGFETHSGREAVKGEIEFFADFFDPLFPWEISDA